MKLLILAAIAIASASCANLSGLNLAIDDEGTATLTTTHPIIIPAK